MVVYHAMLYYVPDYYVMFCYVTVCKILFKSTKLESPQVEAMLQLPQDPNLADEEGNTPLMAAS